MSNSFNASRARQLMRQSGVDVLVATSAVNVKYLSGYACWLDPLFKEYMMSPGGSSDLGQRSFALFPLNGDPALVVKAIMSPDAADLGIRDTRVYGDAGLDYSLPAAPATPTQERFLALIRDTPKDTTAIAALAAVLRDRDLTGGSIGIEMEGLPQSILEELSAAFPRAQFRDCTNVLRLIRAVKTPSEIALLRHAAETAEQAAFECLAEVRIGGNAKDLVEKFRSYVGSKGTVYDHFSFSLSGLGICSDPDYLFRAQDILFIDYGCLAGGYFSDTGTTLSFSELPPEIARRHAAMNACVDAGENAIAPGVKASAVQEAMARVARQAGIVHCFPHGHGVGLEVRDYPILVPSNGKKIRDGCIAVDSDLLLEEGMVINLEAPLFMATAGALQVEKTFVVTADGCCALLKQERTRPYFAA